MTGLVMRIEYRKAEPLTFELADYRLSKLTFRLAVPTTTYNPSGILIHPAVWPQQTWAENLGGGRTGCALSGESWVPI